MRVLFDQGTPQPLRLRLSGHTVDTVFELGWSILKNGELLGKAEQAGYELFITTDQNLRYQQNLAGRRLAIVVLRTTSWPKMREQIGSIQHVIDTIGAGGYEEIPFDARH